MGQISHRETNRIVPLGPGTLVGRAEGSPVHLTNPLGSTHHASLIWTGLRWEVRDLGSTNGTFLDGQPVPPKESVPLARGARLRFGTEREEWELIDDGPPAAAARRTSGEEIRVAQDGLLTLPTDEDPVVTVVLSTPEQWVIEESGSRRPARHGERLFVGPDEWELSIPAPSPVVSTYRASETIHLSRATLRFFVSPEDKHIRLEIAEGSLVCRLPEKACFRLLLLLAKLRKKDADGNIVAGEQGWIHVIDAMDALGANTESAVNTDVFRARAALFSAVVGGADDIVQRRPREIRLCTHRVEIHST